MMRFIFTTILLFSSVLLFAQGVDLEASAQEALLESWKKRQQMAENSILKDFPIKNVGPVVQGGRITDIDVVSPTHYFIGFASGGLFETKNKGITFEPIFDNEGALGIGDFAVAPSDPQIIYIGTGENNSSRSSYAGTGIYKTSDGGKSWKYVGLAGTQHIGRVIVHPKNPDVVWIASMGALYSHNSERGIYKSDDGGNTWKKTLFINDSTGIIDLIINPENPDQLWASAWERTRKSWHFKGSGPGSGIYRSDDGGEKWIRTMTGFPNGSQLGRIGLAVAKTNPSIIYAFLDNQAVKPKSSEKPKKESLQIDQFRDMTLQHLLSLDDELLNKFLREKDFPEKYSAQKVKEDVRAGKYSPKDISDYFGDANAALFETDVVGAELYRSDDSGNTWKKMNSYDLEGVYFTYGYYFGEVRVDPNDAEKVYVFGVPFLKSSDGGKTYARIDTVGDVHVDHHALYIDPSNSQHLLLGNDGGLYESYDEGANWNHINNIPAGQFYTVNYDMQEPYHIYGGLQDNGTLAGSSRSVPNRSEYWNHIFGGDGMYVAADLRNPDIVFVGYQFGNYYRINRKEGKFDYITPQHEIGEDPLRFNWRSPLILSQHNNDIVYLAAQKVYRSLDQGENWESISDDLTNDYQQGNVPFSSISTLAESPIKFGMLYAGTDDGRVHRTDAAGGEWKEISSNLPKDLWVSSIHSSSHDQDVVYITLNGYRFDNFNTYVYKSEDKGENWISIKGNLPEIVVNVIFEDPVNENLLYLGTDHGTYISLDGGGQWHVLNNALNVANYDMKVHPRENELIIGTHGRSVLVMDVKPLQALKEDKVASNIVAFEVSPIKHSSRWGESRYPYVKTNSPVSEFQYYVKEGGTVTVEIFNENNELIRREEMVADTGFNRFIWDLKGGKIEKKKQAPQRYIGPGKYKIAFNKGNSMSAIFFEIKK